MFRIRSRRRGLAAAGFAALLVLVTAACGGSSGSSGGGASASSAVGTIRLYTLSSYKTALPPLIASFEKANPGIHVNAQYVPPGPAYGQTLITEIQGGNAPDVFYTNPGYISAGSVSLLLLGKSGKLANLSSQPWASQVPQSARSQYLIGGKLYGLPLGGGSDGMIYNQSEFAKLGLTPPATWAGLLQLCGKIHAAGKVPVALAGQVPAYLPIAIGMSTVYSGDPSWDAQLAAHQTTFADTVGWQLSLQEISQMSKAGCFQPGAVGTPIAQAFQMTASGQALMFEGPTGALGAIAPLSHDTFAAFPVPAGSAASTRVLADFGDALAVSAQSAHQAAAMKFIDFLARPSTATALANMTGDYSVSQANSGQLPGSLALFGPYFKQGKTVGYPAWLGANQLTAFNTAVQDVLTGQGSVTSALQGVDQSSQG